MTTRELFTKGARVWVPHPEKVWIGATLEENFKGGTIKLLKEDGERTVITVASDSELPPLRNPDILIGENDLTSLSYLHEPAVLYNLQVRFEHQNAIYTYCGIVLVAINPYAELPIYNTGTIWAYRGQAMGDIEPHLFAVAEEAYTKLEREQRDQSIIVSGESGAGKTVSAKYAMRYFATVGGSATETQVEKKVLASSPIMEAFGNAKTTRNDNSSRFGKFIEIQFNPQWHIQGGSMRTYLLEKSRVVFQAPDERNYHIFYQMCAARNSLPKLFLNDTSNFSYLNQGGNSIIAGVDDSKQFEETQHALGLLGFNEREQSDLFKILASILHLGNVQLSSEPDADGGEGSLVDPHDEHLLAFSKLLQLNADEMRCWLTQRKIVSMREVFLKPMTPEEALNARDALAKHIYAELFAWIVAVINKSLQSGIQAHRFIGVLDIYGFETFEINSFEQFCINYANEKLQQQFNQHVFKLEQEEYVKEEIEWKFIDFYDNQPCIDLIETKLGILDLLDEECRVPKGSDSSWVEKLYTKCIKWKHFAKPRFGNQAFVIHHFADNVVYQSSGFLEKNKDTVFEDQINVIKNGEIKLVKKLFNPSEDEPKRLAVPRGKVKISAAKPAPVSSSKQHKKTVGSQFRDSLNMLMSTLNATTPHYVRCIKPNDNKQPFDYNPVRAVQQLRACGVLETIRISAAGFPSRWSYADFFQRYRVLCRFKDINRHDMKVTCERILVFIKDKDKYKFGKSKIFFRAGQVAYLEKLRAEKLLACCITIQKQVRMFVCRKKYLRLKKTALGIQRYARGLLARRKAQHIRRTRAATTIQRHIRGWLHRTRYRRLRHCVLRLQTRIRGYVARQRFIELKRNAKAVIIQRWIRGWLARIHYARDLRSIIIAQAAVRRLRARRRFKELKREARSVEHVKKLNKGLENKIISLQQKLGEVNKENNILKQSQAEVLELKAKIEPMRRLEQEIKRMTTIIHERDQEVVELKEVVESERAEKVDLVNERVKLKSELREVDKLKKNEILKLEQQLNELNLKLTENQQEAEEKLKSGVEGLKNMLLMESEQERTAYQNLLREFHALESHNEELEMEMTRFRGGNANSTNSGHNRSLSNASTASVAEELFSNTPDLPDDDTGYGSVRSTTTLPHHTRLDNIDWQQPPQPAPREHIKQDTSPDSSTKTTNEPMDISLLVKLQHRLNDKQRIIAKLERSIEELEKDNSPRDDTRDSFKVQEMEIENSKLRADLNQLLKGFAEGNPESTLKVQLDVLQEELDRRRDESIYLHSVLANQTQGLKNVASRNYSSHVDLINEDGELILAFEAQKKITRQLEDELQQETAKWKSERDELNHEIKRLREDNERQQHILSANLSATDKTPLSQKEAWMEHELTRVTTDNLDLQEKIETMNEQLKKLKKQNKLLIKRLKDANLLDTMAGGDFLDKPGQVSGSNVSSGTTALQPATQAKAAQQSGAPVIRKKERAFMGMFEYNKENESIIVRHLVYDLKPKIALTLLPGLPAYILFMCIRHTDYTNDDEKVRTLLTSTINTIKKVIKKRHEDLDTIVLWLSNTLRLLHNLKQYSGDKAFQTMNTPKQNEHCLRNFDLSEYRQVLSDIAIWIYQALVTHFEEKMQPLIVPGILEHEAIPSFIEKKPGGMRGRASSVSDSGPSVDVKKSLDLLLDEMTRLKKTLGYHGVDPELITQAFRQLFYYICATSLNNLMLRKELCHWGKGMQLRYNLSHLEQWTRDNCLQDSNVLETLQPIIQAAHLLQARKTEEDVQSICDMCNKLTMLQILKILNLYTSADGFEDRITTIFINKVQATLKTRVDTQDQAVLLLETKYTFPVRFPFNPSNIRLEDIEVPEVLNLPMLKKV